MRKLIALILFSVFLFNLAAIPVWFHITRFMIREDMEQKIKENLDESELTVLTVTEKEFSRLHWTRAQKELEYNGNMFDVVRIQSSNHKKLIYCLSDRREKHLLVQYKAHQKNRKKNRQRISQTEYNKYFPTKHRYLFSSLANKILYPDTRSRILMERFSPPLPPPKPIISC